MNMPELDGRLTGPIFGNENAAVAWGKLNFGNGCSQGKGN